MRPIPVSAAAAAGMRMAVIGGACALLLACGGAKPPQAAPATSSATAPSARAFRLEGAVSGVEDGREVSVRTQDPDGPPDAPQRIVASGKVESGRIALTGQVAQPLPGVLLLGDHTVVRLVVEGGTFRLERTGAGWVVRGGSLNERVNGYLWSPEYVEAKMALDEASRRAFEGVDLTDEQATTAARRKTSPAFARVDALKKDYDHGVLGGDAPVLAKLFVLKDNTDWKRYDTARRRAMLAEYEKVLGAHPVITQMRWLDDIQRRSEEAQAALAVGKPYRDITATDADGKPVRLSDVLKRNRLVLVDFWASWCGPCRGEFPHLAKVYAEFHARGFEIYAVSLDEDKADWLKALREEQDAVGVPWINLQDAGFESKSATAYGVLSLPSNFLIASDGTIVGVGMHEWDIERVVREQVSKAGSATAGGNRRE